jgi:hypothetical protein
VVSQTKVEFVYKICISINLISVLLTMYSLLVRNILSSYVQILSQFVKSPSDTLHRYRMCTLYYSSFGSGSICERDFQFSSLSFDNKCR